MILFFSLSLITSNYYSVDLGTQYIKIAQESFDGEPKIVPNDQNLLYRPSAVAYKYSKPLPERLCDADFKDLQIKFGKSAVSILKKNPQNGIRFLPHILGRANDTFQTSSIANVTDLLALSIMNEFKQISTVNSGIVVSVPSYWTHFQRELISYAFHVSNVQISAIIDDIIGFSVLYTHTKEGYLRSHPRHALVVDIGATSVKAYGMYAKYYKDKFIVNETAQYWSEVSGTYFFAKSYAESKKIKQSKAEKIIQKLNSTEGMEDPVTALKEVVQNAINYATTTFNQSIEEIQLIGGGSRIPFIIEVVKSVSNGIPIRYDFKPIEAHAQGTLLYAKMTEDVSSITPTFVVRMPSSDISLVCDNKVTVPYCEKFKSCVHGPITIKCDGCQKIKIVSSKDGIPLGTNPITQVIYVKDMPYKGDAQSYGKITVESPDQFVHQVQWCSKGKKCINVPFDIDIDLYSGLKHSTQWTFNYIQEKKSIEKLRQMIAKIEEKIIRLGQFLNNEESVSVEATQKVQQEMKEKFNKYQKDLDDGLLYKFNVTSAQKADEELSEIMKTLEIK